MLSKMVEERATTGRRTRLEAARLIGDRCPTCSIASCATLLDDDDVEVARAAIVAVGHAEEARADRPPDRAAGRAGARPTRSSPRSPQFGDRIVGTLRDYLTDDDDADRGPPRDPEGAAGDRHARRRRPC